MLVVAGAASAQTRDSAGVVAPTESSVQPAEDRPGAVDVVGIARMTAEALAREDARQLRLQREASRALHSLCRGCEAGRRVKSMPREDALAPFDAAQAPPWE